jgi:hypothetical protein
MKNTRYIKRFGFTLMVFFATNLFAQTGFDGNAFISLLGKEATSVEMKDLKANYHCEMANDAHYLSKAGVELILKDDLLSEIHLYNKSAVYGNFTGKLPNNLKFGMASGEVKQLLGKPVVSYNNGYCEFEFSTYIISCWLESGRLNQVGVAAK